MRVCAWNVTASPATCASTDNGATFQQFARAAYYSELRRNTMAHGGQPSADDRRTVERRGGTARSMRSR
jgi:hypothetical protein